MTVTSRSLAAQPMRARHLVLLLSALLLLVGASGCATSASIEAVAPARLTPEQERAYRAILTREREHEALIKLRRFQIDRGEGEAACHEQSALPFEDARSSWLLAWCALRARQWQTVLDAAHTSLSYHEQAGLSRRVIELHLMSALAAMELQNENLSKLHVKSAERWLQMTRELLPAPLHDAYGGDLPYLLGRVIAHGAELRPHDASHTPDANRLFDMARYEYAALHNQGAVAQSWRAQARHALERADFGGASASLRRALEIDVEVSQPSEISKDLMLFAAIADALGDREVASQALDWVVERGDAEALLGVTLTPAYPANASQLELLARTFDGRRRLLLALRRERARPASRRSSELMRVLDLFAARSASTPEWLGPFAYELAAEVGEMFAEAGEMELSRRYLRSAVDRIERARRSIGELHARQTFLQSWRHVHMALVHQLVGIDTAHLTQRDYRDALSLVADIKARGLRDLLEGWPRPTPGGQEARVALPPLDVERVAPAALIEQVRRALEHWEHAITLAPVELRRAPHAGDLMAQALSEAIPARAVMLEYVLGERAGYVMVIDEAGEIQMRQTAGTAQLEPLLSEFRATLVDHHYDATDYERHRALSERLYVALIAPAQDLIVDAERIYVAPDASLHDLPFETLARPSTARVPDYLFTQHVLHYVPSAYLLTLLAAREPARARGATRPRGLLIGAPALEQSAATLVAIGPDREHLQADGRLSSYFSELPESSRELSQISRQLAHSGFSRELYQGEAARESVWHDATLEDYDLIHVATHGVSDAQPWSATLSRGLGLEEPVLMFADDASRDAGDAGDGVLRLDEVLGLHTRAALVVLSGCTTGRGWRALGEGAYGLAGAFLASGSREVIASSWSVSDEATRELMTLTYAHLDRSLDGALALNLAQRELLTSSRASSPYLPPFYWAAFRTLGGF